jgi:hypothetical protein
MHPQAKRMACVRTPRVFTRAAPGLQRVGAGRPRLRLLQAGDNKPMTMY